MKLKIALFILTIFCIGCTKDPQIRAAYDLIERVTPGYGKQFKLELIEYLDYYNNRRIKAKLKGLPPAIHRQQALSAA